MRFVKKVVAKLTLVHDADNPKNVGKSKGEIAIGDLHAKPGDIFEIVEGPRETNKGEKRKVVITVCGKDRHDKSDFFYFYGKGKPVKNGHENIWHSNMFVWGIESFKKIGHVNFANQSHEGFQWWETGIPDIDNKMALVDGRWSMFSKLAPTTAKELFNDQEDRNAHSANANMIQRFADWVTEGNDPNDFEAHGKDKRKA